MIDPAEAEAQQPPADAVFDSEFGHRLDRALRSPLSRIIANADSISAQVDGLLRVDYADYANDIASAGRHLLSLVDDLADLSAVERDDFAVEAEPIDLDRRVLRILVNLIGNAVRYSPPGGSVWIRLEREGALGRASSRNSAGSIRPNRAAGAWACTSRAGWRGRWAARHHRRHRRQCAGAGGAVRADAAAARGTVCLNRCAVDDAFADAHRRQLDIGGRRQRYAPAGKRAAGTCFERAVTRPGPSPPGSGAALAVSARFSLSTRTVAASVPAISARSVTARCSEPIVRVAAFSAARAICAASALPVSSETRS